MAPDSAANGGLPPSTLTERATGATWWSAVEIATRYGFQFIVTIILARLLEPSDFGLYALLLIFTSIGELLVNSGFGSALIQRQHCSDNDKFTVFLFSLFISGLLASVLWLVAPSAAEFFAQPQLAELIRLALVTLPLAALIVVPDAVLAIRLDFKSRAISEAIASGVATAIVIVLAWHGFGVISLVVQLIVAASIRAVLLWWMSRWIPNGRFSMASIRSLFAFGSYMLLSSILDAVYVRVQSVLIGRLQDARTLGLYVLAQSAQNAPSSFIGGILMRVGLPVFSSVATDEKKFLSALRLSQRVATFLFVPSMIGLALVAKPLLVLLYGAQWASAAPILSILAVSSSLWPIHVLNFAAIGAKGRSDLIFKVALVQKVVGIGLVISSSPGGPVAIAFATLGATLFSTSVNIYLVKRILNYGLLAQLRDQYSTFALAAVASVSGWSVLHWIPSGLGTMALAIVAAGITYVAGALLFRQQALPEIYSLIRSLSESNPRNPKASGSV